MIARWIVGMSEPRGQHVRPQALMIHLENDYRQNNAHSYQLAAAVELASHGEQWVVHALHGAVQIELFVGGEAEFMQVLRAAVATLEGVTA